MDKICKNCYWYKPMREHANIINCLENFDYREETDTCEKFVTEEDYKPTGVWAGVAKVVKAVADKVKESEG